SSTYSAARMIASASISMAAITACSASSEYGGRRSRYGSRGGSVKYSTGELDIFPGGTFPRRVAKQGRRMIGDHERDTVVPMHLPAQLADRELGLEERLRRETAERDDDFWTYELELPHKIGTARGDFFRKRIAIARRPMLEDVADEDVLALEINRRED